jgi:hypothetical protein
MSTVDLDPIVWKGLAVGQTHESKRIRTHELTWVAKHRRDACATLHLVEELGDVIQRRRKGGCPDEKA